MALSPFARPSSLRLLPLLCISAALLVALRSPAPASAHADKKAQGAELFSSRGCTHCHGSGGEGTDRAPGLHDLRKRMSADKVQSQIVHGGQGMPAFGDILQPGEVDDLVRFLRAKKWTPVPAAPVLAPAKKPDTPQQGRRP